MRSRVCRSTDPSWRVRPYRQQASRYLRWVLFGNVRWNLWMGGMRSLVVVAAVLGAAACSQVAGGTERPRAVIDETQAYLRADQHVCDAVALIGMDVRLDSDYRNSVPMKGLSSAESGRVNVEVRYSLELPPVEDDVFERNRGVFQRLRDRWRGQGYHVVRHDASEPFTVLVVEDRRDGFTVVLKQGKIGNLWLTASSPWVAATGVKPPEPPGCRTARSPE